MTPDEAKASLSLCPPDDATNPYVPGLGEALDLTTANPELGIWWGKEKNFDIYFSRKLSLLAPPRELAPTILRGGATIFYASRLIAESAGEVPEELPNLLDVPGLARSPTPALGQFSDQPKGAPAKQRDPAWLWMRALILVIGGGLLLLIGLFALEYVLANNGPATSAANGTGGQIAKIEGIAAGMSADPASPAPEGQSLAEMRKYLDDLHSPDPANLPALVARPGPDDIINVHAEDWNNFSVSHFEIQTSTSLSHLLILNTKEFDSSDIPTAEFSRQLGPFLERIWSDHGFIYIELTPSGKKP